MVCDIGCLSRYLFRSRSGTIRRLLLTGSLIVNLGFVPEATTWAARTVRIATFNVSLYGGRAGEVLKRLSTTTDPRASCLAEIIQRVRPDLLLLNEVDFDATGRLLDLFQRHYLSHGQNVSRSPEGPAEPIDFPYRFQGEVNTGRHSDFDLDRNGRIDNQPGSRDYGGDCWGFGRYPGQYGMGLLSRFPIDEDQVRTFRKFLWKAMPGALLPDDEGTTAPQDWYSAKALEHFPLSSKSHWDVPVRIDGKFLHLLASHPTPPVFDGTEDRNGRRNHDEIRFWVDYIGPASRSAYIQDDRGKRGGLGENCSFVILGDLNGDPRDGQSQQGIGRLLASPRILAVPAPQSEGAAEQAVLQGDANCGQRGNPHYDTLDATDRPGPGNLRLDYVLPSAHLRIVRSGVYWPRSDEPTFRLVGTRPFPGSDHRLVWADLVLEAGASDREPRWEDAPGH